MLGSGAGVGLPGDHTPWDREQRPTSSRVGEVREMPFFSGKQSEPECWGCHAGVLRGVACAPAAAVPKRRAARVGGSMGSCAG